MCVQRDVLGRAAALQALHGSSQKLGVASTFSGGVFLALAFGHMVPEPHTGLRRGRRGGGLPLDARRLFADLGR